MIEIVDVTDNDLVDMARIESASIVHESRSDGYAPSIEELISLWGNRFLFKSHKYVERLLKNIYLRFLSICNNVLFIVDSSLFL